MKQMIVIKLIGESLVFAVKALVVNKVRTFLSLLGIAIGIFSIISVFTVFDSLESEIKSEINSLGNNILFIQKWPWAMGSDYAWWKYMNRPEATLKEMAELQKRSQTIQAAAFLVGVNRNVYYQNNSMSGVQISGVSQDYNVVLPFDLQEGRYFTPIESHTGNNIAIIGADIAENLYPGEDPVGKRIKIFGRHLDVIGVIKKEGEDIFGNSPDKRIIIPINYARNVLNLNEIGTTIVVMGKPHVSNEEMKDELTGIMRSIRKLPPSADDSFAINEMDIITKGFDQLFGVIAMVGWIIGGFSLLVGGFGVANIMYVSVKERTTQIGIQKSLGAKNYFILLQFLFEAIFLSIIGGIVGLLLVLILTYVVSSFFDFNLIL
ncbi:MAG TPA: ABC transporter permease, partial [Bacteroidales bacterium]